MENLTELVREYYNKNSEDYIDDTQRVNMENQYKIFEKYIKENSDILDIGFGSGRDIVYFSQNYNVYGIDITDNFVNRLKSLGFNNVSKQNAEDFHFDFLFDGIWACASLLHIQKENLQKTFLNCANHLKNGGVFYFSFKYGDFSGIRNGRYFVDMNESLLKNLISSLPFEILEIVKTSDNRPERNDTWLNVVLKKI